MKCVWENRGIHQMMFTFCQFSCKFLGFSMTFFVNIGFISLYFALLICKLLINTNPTRNVVNTNHKAKIEDAKITYALETSTFLFFATETCYYSVHFHSKWMLFRVCSASCCFFFCYFWFAAGQKIQLNETNVCDLSGTSRLRFQQLCGFLCVVYALSDRCNFNIFFLMQCK